jgi:hypothetical protein
MCWHAQCCKSDTCGRTRMCMQLPHTRALCNERGGSNGSGLVQASQRGSLASCWPTDSQPRDRPLQLASRPTCGGQSNGRPNRRPTCRRTGRSRRSRRCRRRPVWATASGSTSRRTRGTRAPSTGRRGCRGRSSRCAAPGQTPGSCCRGSPAGAGGGGRGITEAGGTGGREPNA